MDNKITTQFERIELPVHVEGEESFEDTTLVYSEETSRLVRHLAQNPGLFCQQDEATKVFFELLNTSVEEDRRAQAGLELVITEPVEG